MFSHFNCDLYQILIAFYCFGNNETLERTTSESGLSTTIVQTIFRLLLLYSLKLVKSENNGKIGGPNDPVQIDETYISRRKNHKGRKLCDFWIVGGISEVSNQIFMTATLSRKAPIIQNIISNWVNKNTHIKTDQFKSYNWLDLSPDYTHSTVNHSINFINPIDGTNTQKIERLWEEVKNLKRRRRGFKLDKLEVYIHEFIWRRNFLRTAPNRFYEVLRMAQLYFN
jgi:transposase-like protein